MNPKSILILFLFCQHFFPQLSICQSKPDLRNEMLYLQESNYVHFNKPYYYRGERVWFNAFMLYADITLKDTLSKVLYSDLISPTKQIIRHSTYKIENGTACGDFPIGDTLKAGTYFLRVYTSWNRNYGDSSLQYYPIRVYDYDQIPISNAAKIKKCDYFSPVSDTLKANQNYNWILNIPELKNYSISIINTEFIKKLSENYSSNIVNEYPSEKQFDLKLPIERGLIFNGTFQTKKNKKVKFSALRKSNNEISNMETDEKGHFSYTWDGEQLEDKLVLNVENKSFTTLNGTTKTLPNFVLPKIKEVLLERSKAPFFAKDTFEKGAIILDEVAVKGKTFDEKLAPINKLYGKPDNIVYGEDIVNSQAASPILALQGKVPGLTVILGVDGAIKVDFRGSRTGSFGDNVQPLIMVDGVPTNGDVSYISLNSIKRIEVVKRISAALGARGANGIINIITKGPGFVDSSLKNESNSIFNINLKGFDNHHPFQSNDLQPYWISNVLPSNDGSLVIPFKSIFGKTNYQIELIGVLQNGNLIKCYKNVVVE